MKTDQNKARTGALVDYYAGRGAQAQYLGTARAPWDDMPAVVTILPEWDSAGPDLAAFRAHVASQDASAVTWPHEYPNSTGTPWTVCYDAGSLYVYRYGVEMAIVRLSWTRRGSSGPVPRDTATFPTLNRGDVGASLPPKWSDSLT